MKPIYISIRSVETGRRIKELIVRKGYTVKDVQGAMGFENPQAIYKWMSGKSMPSLDNIIILSKMLNTEIENLLVLDEDIAFLKIILNYRFNDRPVVF
jgi:transcriptional regulator with XRE-family HTH domain